MGIPVFAGMTWKKSSPLLPRKRVGSHTGDCQIKSVDPLIQSATFKHWLAGLKDRRAAMRVHARIDRAACGNFGDIKKLWDGVIEMRIDYGPGYRIYFIRRGSVVVVLLSGGDKSTQDADIARAVAISKEWSD